MPCSIQLASKDAILLYINNYAGTSQPVFPGRSRLLFATHSPATKNCLLIH